MAGQSSRSRATRWWLLSAHRCTIAVQASCGALQEAYGMYFSRLFAFLQDEEHFLVAAEIPEQLPADSLELFINLRRIFRDASHFKKFHSQRNPAAGI